MKNGGKNKSVAFIILVSVNTCSFCGNKRIQKHFKKIHKLLNSSIQYIIIIVFAIYNSHKL